MAGIRNKPNLGSAVVAGIMLLLTGCCTKQEVVEFGKAPVRDFAFIAYLEPQSNWSTHRVILRCMVVNTNVERRRIASINDGGIEFILGDEKGRNEMHARGKAATRPQIVISRESIVLAPGEVEKVDFNLATYYTLEPGKRYIVEAVWHGPDKAVYRSPPSAFFISAPFPTTTQSD